MSLRLVRTPQPTPIPVTSLAAPPLRRPGERHEAVAIPGGAAEAIAGQAVRCGVPLDLAATLLVEACLALDWLEAAGAANFTVTSGPPVALSAAEADYLRALTVGRKPGRSQPPLGDVTVSVPVRLVARCSPDLLPRAAADVDLKAAIHWEAGALREGLMMGEWLTRQALRSDAVS